MWFRKHLEGLKDRPRNQARTFPFPKGESMSTALIRILIVGSSTSGTDGIVKKLTGAGWGSHSVASVAEAETVLKTIRFKVVLSAEKLPDGTGYELASLIGRQAGTLFIGVSLSETCLWLPVVERGSRTLGRRAMNPTMLEAEVSQLLRPVRGPETEWSEAEASGQQRPMAFPIDPLRADLLAGVIQDNSVLRERNRGRAPMPPRRRFAEGAAEGKHLMSSPAREAKPPAGMAGKHWRG